LDEIALASDTLLFAKTAAPPELNIAIDAYSPRTFCTVLSWKLNARADDAAGQRRVVTVEREPADRDIICLHQNHVAPTRTERSSGAWSWRRQSWPQQDIRSARASQGKRFGNGDVLSVSADRDINRAARGHCIDAVLNRLKGIMY